ncbi:MAG: tRNA lysidine(34) synthetase TilS [Bacteroidetes bacterium]|nr:tRNA lysidine(34) synthetase TilS [Bacteroidota bacterium]
MQKKFESNILKKQLFSKEDKILVAISGGVDSVVLAHLLKKAGFDFALAHCNFKLRAKDSSADENFCKALAKELDVKIFTQQFNTAAFSKKNKLSIQMAARKLRYDWFNELTKKNKFDHLVTAHHANDVVETVFINLLRGTGIKGLKGIAEKKGNIVRPLLNFTKEEISTFAKKKKISYRTDKSNRETKYERNFLRLDVIPKLKKLHPNLEQVFLNNVANFKEEAAIVNDFLVEKANQLLSKKGSQIVINKIKLKKEKHLQTLLHFILEPFGFNQSQIKDIKANLLENGETGKFFFTSSFTLTVDREQILIKPLSDKVSETIKLNTLNELKSSNLIKLDEIKEFKGVENNELVIEKNKLIFPLIIRARKTGDKFRPFGMKGFKLVSDFLKDQKLNAFEKENCRLLENGNGDIIWVIGRRSDDRYKIETKKDKLLKLTLIE